MEHGPGLYERFRGLNSASDTRPDGELLERFVADGDADAFTVLLRRHGPLVWGVCRRVLGRVHDAEDAFQGTFLVLARRASSVRRRSSVRCWLYGVALRVALRAREQIARRREESAIDPPTADDGPSSTLDQAELMAALDDEICQLPERYRRPLVLCYLLGRTNEAAARELGCPKGTVAVRLARGRERLRRRLLKRGLGPLAALPVPSPGDVMPGILAPSTRAVVFRYLAGRTQSGTAVKLAKGALRSMFFDKCKAVFFVLLAAGTLVGSGLVGRAVFAQTPPVVPVPAPEDKPQAAGAADAGTLDDLLRRRQQSAKIESDERFEKFIQGQMDTNITVEATRRLLRAELELSQSKEGRLAAWQEHAVRLARVVEVNQARYNAGRTSTADLELARYYHLEALIEVKRLKSQ